MPDYSKADTASINILNKIITTPSINTAKANRNNKKQRVGRNLLLSKQNEQITVVCETTGIVSLVDIPAIPGSALVWTSPFQSVDNCRGLISQGIEYLNLLDIQILAGIFLTVAIDYDLLRFQPSDSGAQKNAILRTAGKTTLINALTLVEEYVHSHNHIYLPTLSLILDSTVNECGVADRMTEWLKIVAAEILKSRFPTYEDTPQDTFYKEVPKKQITPDYIKAERRKEKSEDWAATNAKWAEQRIYKEDIKAAKILLKTLALEETLSPKLSGLLKSIFLEDSLLTMNSSMRALLALKMSSFTSASAASLVVILSKPYTILRKETEDLDLSLVDNEVPYSEPETLAPIALEEPIVEEVVPAPRRSFQEILAAKRLLAAADK